MPVTLLSHAMLTETDALSYLREDRGLEEERKDMMRLLINSITEQIEGLLHVPVVSREFVQRYDGGARRIFLRYVPVVSVGSVERLKTDDTVLETISSDDYWLVAERGELLHRTGVWSYDLNAWRVTYSPGWTAVPSALQEAALIILAKRWRDYDTQRDEIISTTIEGQTTIIANDPIPKRARLLLAPYIKRRVL